MPSKSATLPYLALLLLAMAMALPAAAACRDRPYQVPLAPIGISVVVAATDTFSGIYPQLLSTITAETGCQFRLRSVPRARLEAMFEAGQADLLMPAVRTPRRDRHGVFVPTIAVRATLISIDQRMAPVTSSAQLLARRDMRVALVRGNDYGEAYHRLVRELSAQGRTLIEVDPLSVARLLKRGLADIAILTPTSFAGAIKDDERVRDMLPRLQFAPLDELPWQESGVYISKTSVSPAERAYLSDALRGAYKVNAVWDQYKQHYPPEVVAAGARPR